MSENRVKRVVGFSGGVDSQAAALWVRNRYDPEDVILLNADAGGNEHPITTRFIADYSRDVFPVVTVSAVVADLGGVGSRDEGTAERRREYADDEPLTFDRLAHVKGVFPARTRQFCTSYLKLIPQRRWLAENLAGVPHERYAGVRRDESASRAKLPASCWDEEFRCVLHRPLIDWTKQMCFDFVRAHGETVNPLYTMGFSRVGCAPCVNSGKEDVRNWSARFPEMIDKVRGWEASTGRTFFAPCVPGKAINWIDEVVEWSKTVRGGRQYSLPFFEAEAKTGGCLSDHGLCE